MKRKVFIIGVLIATLLFIGYIGFSERPAGFVKPTIESDVATADTTQSSFQIIADELYVPWDIAFLPNGDMLVTERNGNVLLITETGSRSIHRVGSYESGEGGLLGMVLHPQFAENEFLYIYYTYRSLPDGTTQNRVERYIYRDETLTDPFVVIDSIPGARYHDGGRIAFGPDAHVYITTGDAGKPALAQDISSLAGKILRLRDDGTIPNDNPFPQSPVYSYGHRNPQGLTWDAEGRLWSTEHGRSGLFSGFDEINRIAAGGNYGWPDSQGDTAEQGTERPALHSGSDVTWAPASAAFHNGSIYFGGLRGEALYEAVVNDTTVVDLKKHHHTRFGRIRTVRIGPDNMLYMTTSNRDGRGTLRDRDDKVIRLPLP